MINLEPFAAHSRYFWPAYTYRLVTVAGVVVCNSVHMQRNSPGAARGGPVVLRPVRATPCLHRNAWQRLMSTNQCKIYVYGLNFL